MSKEKQRFLSLVNKPSQAQYLCVNHSITSERHEQLLPRQHQPGLGPASDLPARGAGHLPRAVRHRVSARHSGQHLHRGHSCQVSPAHPH